MTGGWGPRGSFNSRCLPWLWWRGSGSLCGVSVRGIGNPLCVQRSRHPGWVGVGIASGSSVGPVSPKTDAGGLPRTWCLVLQTPHFRARQIASTSVRCDAVCRMRNRWIRSVCADGLSSPVHHVPGGRSSCRRHGCWVWVWSIGVRGLCPWWRCASSWGLGGVGLGGGACGRVGVALLGPSPARGVGVAVGGGRRCCWRR